MNVTINVDPTKPAELDAAEKLLKYLRTQYLAEVADEVRGRAMAEELIKALKPKIGDVLRRMLVAEAELSAKGPYAMADAGARLGQTARQARSHTANIGRVKHGVEYAPPFREEQDEPGTYLMPEAVRAAVLKYLK